MSAHRADSTAATKAVPAETKSEGTRMHALNRVTAGGCLATAPALQGLSTFFWHETHQGVIAGALNVVAAVCWVVGLVAVFRSIEARLPRYAAIALPAAVYGAIGGVTFGVQGMYEELLGVSHDHAVRLVEAHPAAAFAGFWIAGPLFPLSVLALGIALLAIRAVPVPVGALMCIGAVAFPISRIPREVVVAHVADLLLLLPFLYVGARLAIGTWPVVGGVEDAGSRA